MLHPLVKLLLATCVLVAHLSLAQHTRASRAGIQRSKAYAHGLSATWTSTMTRIVISQG